MRMTDTNEARAALVCTAGLTLYGPEWCALLARDIQVNERTLRRIRAAYLAGQDYPIADGLLQDLADFLRGRADSLQAVAATISRQLGR